MELQIHVVVEGLLGFTEAHEHVDVAAAAHRPSRAGAEDADPFDSVASEGLEFRTDLRERAFSVHKTMLPESGVGGNQAETRRESRRVASSRIEGTATAVARPSVGSPAINHAGAISAPSVLAPASRQKANSRAPALIEGRLPLPGRFLLSDPARLASMHGDDGLSVVQIARRLGVRNAGVVAALRRLGIATDGRRKGHAVKGQVAFGWDFQESRLVRNGAEQQVIRLMRQLQGGGESLNGIARGLNRRLVPTKNAGVWQANTVGKILHRVAARAAS